MRHNEKKNDGFPNFTVCLGLLFNITWTLVPGAKFLTYVEAIWAACLVALLCFQLAGSFSRGFFFFFLPKKTIRGIGGKSAQGVSIIIRHFLECLHYKVIIAGGSLVRFGLSRRVFYTLSAHSSPDYVLNLYIMYTMVPNTLCPLYWRHRNLIT